MDTITSVSTVPSAVTKTAIELDVHEIFADSDDSASIHSDSGSLANDTSSSASTCDDEAIECCKPSSTSRSLWRDPKNYALSALQSPWHTSLFRLQNTLFNSSTDFFRSSEVNFKYLIVPLTTGSISSPMGFGSDSMPVSIELNGQQTYLADSQQFLLEYALRLESGVPGVYYVGTSCRGEDPDSTHLNQFCHVECELLGGLDSAIKIANQYVVSLTKAFLKSHRREIERYAGSTAHMTELLELYRKHGNAFPVITLDEALALPSLTDEMWEYAVADKPEFGKKITRKGERMLIELFGGAVWLTEIDHLSAPFYQAYTSAENRNKAKAGDLLFGLGEVLGCGERHASLDDTLEALKQHEVDPEEYRWYVDMRSLRPWKTSGWGIGTERFMAWVLQHDDIRDVQLLPRLKGLEIAP